MAARTIDRRLFLALMGLTLAGCKDPLRPTLVDPPAMPINEQLDHEFEQAKLYYEFLYSQQATGDFIERNPPTEVSEFYGVQPVLIGEGAAALKNFMFVKIDTLLECDAEELTPNLLLINFDGPESLREFFGEQRARTTETDDGPIDLVVLDSEVPGAVQNVIVVTAVAEFEPLLKFAARQVVLAAQEQVAAPVICNYRTDIRALKR